jgi:hypothetical protein
VAQIESAARIIPWAQILIGCRFPEVTALIKTDNNIFLALRPNANDIRIEDINAIQRVKFGRNQHFIFIAAESDVEMLEKFQTLAQQRGVTVDIITLPWGNMTAQLLYIKEELIKSLGNAYARIDQAAA